MNDRLRFRVYDKINNSYVTDCYFIDQLGDLIKISEDDDHIDRVQDQDNFIVEQCTGLRDKNGTLIFEGDFVKIAFRDQTLHYCVKYDQSNCQLYLSCGEMEFSESFDVLDDWAIEITGNIQEMEMKDE